MKLRKKSLLIRFTIFVFFILLIYNGYTVQDYKNWFSSNNGKYDNKCNPYLKKNLGFQITIDNKIYPQFMPIYLQNNLNFTCLNQNNKSNLILFWNKWYGIRDFQYGLGKHEPFKKNYCPVWSCELTDDRNRLNESDIIIFHMNDPIHHLPRYRHPNQRWVFFTWEPPMYFTVRTIYKQYDNLFNLSFTYRQSSNFSTFFYSDYIWTENKDFNSEFDFSANKTEFAVIIVSNCRDDSKRLEYVKELQKYIPVLIYGNCGKPCPVGYARRGQGQDDCKKVFAPKSKFYFAFENSFCKEYVTEKLLDTIRYNTIPVVYGLGNYDRYVPKSGYINALDFASPKALADYLIYLDKNKTAYNSYFQWKRFIKFMNKTVKYPGLCEMCIRLNLDNYEGITKSVISSMETFWNPHLECKVMDARTFKLKIF